MANIKVYMADLCSHHAELNAVKEIIQRLDEDTQSVDWDIYVALQWKLEAEIDVAIFFPNTICVLELKTIPTPFEATENTWWKITNGQRSDPLFGTKNPISQTQTEARELREDLSNFLQKKPPYLHSYIVVSPALSQKQKGDDKHPTYTKKMPKILRIDDLEFEWVLDTTSKYPIASKDVEDYLKSKGVLPAVNRGDGVFVPESARNESWNTREEEKKAKEDAAQKEEDDREKEAQAAQAKVDAHNERMKGINAQRINDPDYVPKADLEEEQERHKKELKKEKRKFWYTVVGALCVVVGVLLSAHSSSDK